MAETPAASGTAPINDRRPVPRGVLPKGLQMWLMVGVAVGMVGIIMFTGHSQPTPRTTPAAASPPPGLSPDRLRDYQERLRALDERARLQPMPDPSRPVPAAPQGQDDRTPRQTDPLVEERKRREYDFSAREN